MFFFSCASWLNKLFQTFRTRKTPHRRNPAAGLRARPRLELLEDRLAPAVTVLNVDSLVNDLDNDGFADPGDRIHYNVTVSTTTTITGMTFQEIANDPNLTLVPGSINVSPLAIDDTFTAVANTQLRVGTPAALAGPAASVAGSVLANDIDFLGDTSFFISAFDATSVQGGTVSMVTSGANAGSFYYVPGAGDTGADSFTYTLTDKGIDGLSGTPASDADNLSTIGTVNITIGTTKVWYVDSNAASGGDGRSSTPFDSLADVSGGGTGPDGAGDIIYVTQRAAPTTAAWP